MSVKKYGSGMRKGTAERLKAAMHEDNTILVSDKELETAQGKTESYLEYLGLRKSDLLRLERHGFAIRGYLNPLNEWRKPSGFRKRWLIVVRGDHGTDESKQGQEDRVSTSGSDTPGGVQSGPSTE